MCSLRIFTTMKYTERNRSGSKEWHLWTRLPIMPTRVNFLFLALVTFLFIRQTCSKDQYDSKTTTESSQKTPGANCGCLCNSVGIRVLTSVSVACTKSRCVAGSEMVLKLWRTNTAKALSGHASISHVSDRGYTSSSVNVTLYMGRTRQLFVRYSSDATTTELTTKVRDL